ncbi:hypothetical protein [Rhodococcoides kyotonense]|uniref:Uncharacterized protein n=1 Tax=Rhodococcoides kyotonense TaxID=398843 RepID=A0A239MVF5_9NOCA|nr:hypothetical protein [Rhodococcus kyotonensis]SNT46490.1 hypothetical protein SAMN05421642_12326 [Rhodococcus kyotonensis]
MSQREYKEYYVVNDDIEQIHAKLVRAADSRVLDLSVTGEDGISTFDLHDPVPHYWESDELSHVIGRSAEGDQVNLDIKTDGEPATLIVWADEQ